MSIKDIKKEFPIFNNKIQKEKRNPIEAGSVKWSFKQAQH